MKKAAQTGSFFYACKVNTTAWFHFLHKVWSWLPKVSLPLGLFYIIWKCWGFSVPENLWVEENERESGRWIWLAGLILLMLLNWLLEITKWWLALQKGGLTNQTISSASKGVLAGLSIGLFSPNRVGEFAGRLGVLAPEDRKSGFWLNLLCNIPQLMATVAIGLGPCLHQYQWVSGETSLAITGMLIIAAGLFCFLLPGVLARIQLLKSILPEEKPEMKKVMLSLWFLSVIRYICFSVQFALVLAFVNAPVGWTEMTTAIPAIFLIITCIPTMAWSELGVRASVSSYVLAMYGVDAPRVAVAAFLLWLLNLALPALIGAIWWYSTPQKEIGDA